MKRLQQYFLISLIVTLVMGGSGSIGYAQENWAKEDPVGQGWSAMDLVFARPFGVAAGIAGTALFIVTLPFTIPSGGVKDAAEMFIVKPFSFSFTREFPDGDI